LKVGLYKVRDHQVVANWVDKLGNSANQQ
jgi:hypothetical protein